jgi:hypothetical protein
LQSSSLSKSPQFFRPLLSSTIAAAVFRWPVFAAISFFSICGRRGAHPACANLQRALPGLTIVAVNEGRETAADTARFLKAHGADALHVYLDPDHAFLEALGVQGLPLSVLIDTRGMARAKASGPAEWDDPAAVIWLREVATQANAQHAP